MQPDCPVSASGDSVSLRWGGEALWLLPQRAVWWPSEQTLLVADVHIGKAASFRSLGVPVPEATTQDTLSRLDQLLQRCKASRLVVLGDLLHSARMRDTVAEQALLQWRQAHTELHIVLVRGNHDDRAGDPAASLRVDCVDEPAVFGGLLALHDPASHAGAPALAGHTHPGVRLQGRGRDRLRLPCFTLSPHVLTLPAFGAFTGMHTVTPGPGLQVFPVGPDRVFDLRGV